MKWNAEVPFGRAANALLFRRPSIGVVGTLSTPVSLAQTDRPAEKKTWRIVVLNNADFLFRRPPYGASAARDVDARSPVLGRTFRRGAGFDPHPGAIDDLHYALLRKKYEKIKVDLVMLRGRGSIDFVRRYGDELWPNVPVVFYNERLEVLRDRAPRRIPPAYWSTSTLPPRSIWHCAASPCTQYLRRWRNCCVRSKLETPDAAAVVAA